MCGDVCVTRTYASVHACAQVCARACGSDAHAAK